MRMRRDSLPLTSQQEHDRYDRPSTILYTMCMQTRCLWLKATVAFILKQYGGKKTDYIYNVLLCAVQWNISYPAPRLYIWHLQLEQRSSTMHAEGSIWNYGDFWLLQVRCANDAFTCTKFLEQIELSWGCVYETNTWSRCHLQYSTGNSCNVEWLVWLISQISVQYICWIFSRKI